MSVMVLVLLLVSVVHATTSPEYTRIINSNVMEFGNGLRRSDAHSRIVETAYNAVLAAHPDWPLQKEELDMLKEKVRMVLRLRAADRKKRRKRLKTGDTRKVLTLLKEGKNVLVCGPAGLGKTYCLSEAVSVAKARNLNVAIITPTGTTAQNLCKETGACTLYRFVGIGAPHEVEDFWKNGLWSRAKWENLDVIIINKISFFNPDFLDWLDCLVGNVVKKPDTVFGGIQVMAFGDFRQLKGVAGKVSIELILNQLEKEIGSPGDPANHLYRIKECHGFAFQSNFLFII